MEHAVELALPVQNILANAGLFNLAKRNAAMLRFSTLSAKEEALGRDSCWIVDWIVDDWFSSCSLKVLPMQVRLELVTPTESELEESEES